MSAQGSTWLSVVSDEDQLEACVNVNGTVEVALGAMDGSTPHIATFTHEQFAWLCRQVEAAVRSYTEESEALEADARGGARGS